MPKLLLLVAVQSEALVSAGKGDPRQWKAEDFDQLGIPYDNVAVYNVETMHGERLRFDEDEDAGFTEV